MAFIGYCSGHWCTCVNISSAFHVFCHFIYHIPTANERYSRIPSDRVLAEELCLFFCLCTLHQSYLTARTANCFILGEIGFQSALPLDGAWVYNVPEDSSPRTQIIEPPFIA